MYESDKVAPFAENPYAVKVSGPTDEDALSFAILLSSGVPAEEVIRYFCPPDDPDSLGWAKTALPKWLSARNVKKAIKQVQGGKEWQELSLEQKMRLAVDKNYTEMAYFLYSHNYASLVGSDKQKADTCRQALEAKMAGMAGKMDAMSQFFNDITSGAIKLPSMAASGPPKGGAKHAGATSLTPQGGVDLLEPPMVKDHRDF